MARLRTFIAVDLSADVRRRAKGLQHMLREGDWPVRWVDPNQLHVTLKFLGDVEESQTYAVCQAVERVTRRTAGFALACHGVGAFPQLRRPRTIWLGLDDADGRLSQLQGEMEHALRALGFPQEHRPFQAHVTLGRVQEVGDSRDDLASALEAVASFDAGTLDVDQVTIYTSQLARSGPVYAAISRLSLGG